MDRRGWVLAAGVGAAAVAAGAGWALWRQRGEGSSMGEGAQDELWRAQFDSPRAV